VYHVPLQRLRGSEGGRPIILPTIR
jgi:hypothetical protein